MAKYDLLVAGEINPDLILSDPKLTPQFGQIEILVENANLTIGSSSVIFACGAARLGLKVAFTGVTGDDIFGRFMLDAMQQRDIDVSNVIVDPGQSTGISVILNRASDRAILTYIGAINALRPQQITDKLLRQTRHIHIASYFLQTQLQPGVLDIFRRARARGLSTSLDTNWDPEDKWVGIEDVLSETTIFFPNEREGAALTGEETPQEIVDKLASRAEIVALKMGADGAIAQQGNRIYRSPALKVDVVDTVGAGDNFDAGFVYGFLQGWPLEKSLKLAVICGSLSTQAPGGTDGQPTIETAMKAMENLSETT
jgi:sugar/nucleoside kinase (ribokinase family)